MADPAPMTEDQARALEIFSELFNDPASEAGKALRAKAKEKNPNLRLPEDAVEPLIAPYREANDALKARLDAMEAERAEEKKTREDDAAKNNLEAALAGARQRFNLTDEGFDKMVARMKETGNYGDAEAAAAWVAQQTPPPQAPGPYLGPQLLNLAGSAQYDEKFALLHKDPMGAFLDSEFREFLADPVKYSAEAGFPYQ
jgi:hypothetical protein